MTKPYKAVVIDDEPIAIDIIVRHLKEVKSFELAGTFTNAVEALSLLHEQKIDLLFLDIEMPGISGLDFAKSIPQQTAIIFTTAYRDYAVDAFDLEVVDYLLKPVSFSRFLKAVTRFFSHAEKNVSKETSNSEEKIIELKADKKVHKVKTNEILFVESEDDYIKVHTTRQKLLIYMRMHQIQNLLDDTFFLRVHRSFLVNTKFIEAYSSVHVEIAEKNIPIGKTYREQVADKLKS